MEYLVTFRGSVVSAEGSGTDSISVTLSSGRADNRAAGRSTGEQPTMTCRRCEFAVKKERFSAMLSVNKFQIRVMRVSVPRIFRPELPSLPMPTSTKSKLAIRPLNAVDIARSEPRLLILSCRTRYFARPSRFAYTLTMISRLSASSNCGLRYSRVRTSSSSARASPP